MGTSDDQRLSHHEVDKLIVETAVIAITIWLSLGLFLAEQEPEVGLEVAFSGPTVFFAIAIICATMSLERGSEVFHVVAMLAYFSGWGFFLAIGCSMLVPREWASSIFRITLSVILGLILAFLIYNLHEKRKAREDEDTT